MKWTMISCLVWLVAGAGEAWARSPGGIIEEIEGINKKKPCQIDPAMAYVCDSMSTFSCKPGTFEDGTGKVLSEDDYQKKIAPIRARVEKVYETAVLKALNDQDPKYELVRELAVKATLQSGTPGCEMEKKTGRNECFKRVASILAAHRTRAEFGPHIQSQFSDENAKSAFDHDAFYELIRNGAFSSAMNDAHKKAVGMVTDATIEKKIRKEIFPEVRTLLIEKVKESIADPEIERKVIQKIQNIGFSGVDCSSMLFGGEQEGKIPGLMFSNAYYSAEDQTFRFCNGFLLKNNSEFSIAMVIAHELSHSIDPCHIQKPIASPPVKYSETPDPKLLEGQYPIPGLLQCLRARESIGAVNRREHVNSKSDSETSGKNVVVLHRQRAPFCDHQDQIGEAFSDWMGAEVLGDFIEKNHSKLSPREKLVGYSNVFRSLKGCDSSEEDFDIHPSKKNRIDRLIMANPEVRSQIGCGEPANGLHHCKAGETFEGTRAVFVEKPKPEEKLFHEEDHVTPEGPRPKSMPSLPKEELKEERGGK